jgi:hypothetical protein
MMLVLFLTIIIMVTILQLAEPPASIVNIPVGQLSWLLVWLRWGLAVMFAAIGLGLGRGEYLGIALFYTILSLLFNFQIPVTLGLFTFIINGPVLTLGIFFTILTGFQIFKIDDLVNKLLLAAKSVELQKLREQVETIHEQVMIINEKIHQRLNPNENVGDPDRESTINLQVQRQTALESMESLLRIIDRVEKVPVERRPLRRIVELSAPVVTSFVFPILATEIGELF